MSVSFYQYNVRDLDKDIEFVKRLKEDENNVLIGMEITHKLLKTYSDINYDPQHSEQHKCKRACVEDLYFGLKELCPKIMNKHVWGLFLKIDLDAIAAGAVLKLFIDNGCAEFDDDVMKRIRAIANYDRHGRPWEPTLMNLNQLSKVKIPRGLFMLVSGWKTKLDYKIEQVTKWLISGTFDEMDKFNKMAAKNFKDAVTSAKVEVIDKRKFAFVKSTTRGAMGLGFQYAPVVLALNPSFRFGFGDVRTYGRKWSIAQCHSGYIDMHLLRNKIGEVEDGWGGSDTIIGSPQDRPSTFRKYPLVDIVRECIKSQDDINNRLYLGE